MLTHEFLEVEGILILTPKGPLAAKDFEDLATEVDPYIESSGSLQGLLIEAESFPGWEDFGSLLSHFRFVRDHHRRIARVAIVSDSSFLSIAPKLADHYFTAEVRHFGEGERNTAMSWLCEG